MDTKHGLLFLALACFELALVSAVPDWVPPEILEMVQEDKQRCMAEHGTTEEMIQEVGKGNIKDEKPTTCYMFCLLEAFSLVDDEANLETDMLLGILPEDLQAKASEVLGTCTPTTGSDNCNKLFNLATCVYNQVPALWFIV